MVQCKYIVKISRPNQQLSRTHHCEPSSIVVLNKFLIWRPVVEVVDSPSHSPCHSCQSSLPYSPSISPLPSLQQGSADAGALQSSQYQVIKSTCNNTLPYIYSFSIQYKSLLQEEEVETGGLQQVIHLIPTVLSYICQKHCALLLCIVIVCFYYSLLQTHYILKLYNFD